MIFKEENPLFILGVPAMRRSWGGIDYERVALISLEDNDISKKIADLWVKAYQEMKKQFID